MRTFLTVLSILTAILGAVYQLHLRPILVLLGMGRVIHEVGNKDCKIVPELQACEKIVLHEPSGLLYLACSTPSTRSKWCPALQSFLSPPPPSPHPNADYIATYDPHTSVITRLTISSPSPLHLAVHGLSVVPSHTNTDEVYVYLVNHAPYSSTGREGANSTVEVFKGTVKGKAKRKNELVHLRTVYDENVIRTPNDVVGSGDGKSFYFTNDFGALKTGLKRTLNPFLRRPLSSIGYCTLNLDSTNNCKLVTEGIHDANGIAAADPGWSSSPIPSDANGYTLGYGNGGGGKNETFYVANTLKGSVSVLERQADHRLVLVDVIQTDMVLDNLSVDQDGMLWAGALPNARKWQTEHYPSPSNPSPSAALRISQNTGSGVFYGLKYRVDKMFEDSGEIASGVTSAVYDAKRRVLFLHGLSSPHLTVCNL